MKQINILVLGVGGNVSQGIVTALRISKIPCRIIGACISADSLGLYMCDAAYISPRADDSSFVSWVADLCNKESVSIVFSGVEEVVFSLELNRLKLISLTSAIFISSNINQLNIANNKYLTVEWLKNNQLNYPKYAHYANLEDVHSLIRSCGFPLIAKPNKGKGSIGIIKLLSEKDLELIPNKDYCIQQYLGNEAQEYTVACYVDKTRTQQNLIIMRRELKYGTTFMAEIVENQVIRDECTNICNAFNPNGPLNIQLRLHENIPVCFELNVRFSGTTPIRARFGYNDVLAMIKEYVLNEDPRVAIRPASKGRVYRYFNEFYMDMEMHNELEIKKEAHSLCMYNNYQENLQ